MLILTSSTDKLSVRIRLKYSIEIKLYHLQIKNKNMSISSLVFKLIWINIISSSGKRLCFLQNKGIFVNLQNNVYLPQIDTKVQRKIYYDV